MSVKKVLDVEVVSRLAKRGPGCCSEEPNNPTTVGQDKKGADGV